MIDFKLTGIFCTRICILIFALTSSLSQAALTPSRSNDDPANSSDLAPREIISYICEKNLIIQTTSFILYNNLWGEDYASTGSQCTYLNYEGQDSISWQTAWTWEGGDAYVKSYANAVLDIDATQLSAISSLKSTWGWSYSGNNIVGDVSYDAFLSSQASTTASHDYEIMIWLASYGGAQPIGYSAGSIASVTISGIVWNLYNGTNDGWKVFSFVASETIAYYSGDIHDFFKYLIDNQNVPDSYYLQTIGAGTEPFTGSDAWFTVSPYTISLN
ncbi:concanavalin A-like lectin/glucanase [Penicillium macrosclerotiorum]|uniref:concanavalin A-like lectin/glucanase n=1 Tax=Penicillium macrosclerotiorum TaxID=303699 RepID=UPI0025476A9F|nr:concanavalin A-like lectin/glucanase [Penicillium macrosclerotiorum]KAJ5690666.1 concanavalin A-like lectin/glucanase [Penicillium macrosclerotiorum]